MNHKILEVFASRILLFMGSEALHGGEFVIMGFMQNSWWRWPVAAP